MKTFGIAIPTYNKHLIWLKELLDSIDKSTIKPDQVSISVSSYDFIYDLAFTQKYDFPVHMHITPEYKNPSQNRNIAGNSLTTDIISFMDGDDLVLSKRTEYLLKAFNVCGSKIVCHNYFKSNYQEDIDKFILFKNYIDTVDPSCPFPKNKEHQDYHCAHVSMLKEIFEKFKFNEDDNFKYREDSLYLTEIVKSGLAIDYIQNKLSLYRK